MRIWHKNIDSVHAFYVNGLLRSLYMSLTSIFVPIFVYGIGRGVGGSMKAGLLYVVLYFVVQRVIVSVSVFPLSKIIEKMGFRRSISWSVLFLMGYTLALLLVPHNLAWLWVSAVCGGIQIPLYWISRDSALSQDVPGKQMGSKMGYIIALENITSLLGPVVGGVIVLTLGYPTLFIVSLLILIMSTIPLWWMPPHSHKNGVSFKGFWYFLSDGRYMHQVISNIGCALNDYGNGIIWPLILFLQGINHEKLGAVYSLVGLVTVGVQYASGKWFDKLRAKRDYSDEGVYGFATLGVSLSWVVRIFAQGLAQIVRIDLIRQLFGTVYANFFVDYLHLGGKRMGSIAFWVYMEVIYSIAAIFIFGVMAVGIYFGNWKEMVLITISLWSLVTVVIARESNL